MTPFFYLRVPVFVLPSEMHLHHLIFNHHCLSKNHVAPVNILLWLKHSFPHFQCRL